MLLTNTGHVCMPRAAKETSELYFPFEKLSSCFPLRSSLSSVDSSHPFHKDEKIGDVCIQRREAYVCQRDVVVTRQRKYFECSRIIRGHSWTQQREVVHVFLF